jgi:hypothetical protein
LANSLGWQRDLQDPLRSSTRVGELLGGEEAAAPQPAEDGDRRTLDALVADLVAVPVAPEQRVEVPVAEALDHLRELALKRQTTHLTVGDHSETGVFLQTDRRLDSCVLHPLELGRTDLTALQALSRLEKPARPEETADDVRARRDHDANLREAHPHAASRAYLPLYAW